MAQPNNAFGRSPGPWAGRIETHESYPLDSQYALQLAVETSLWSLVASPSTYLPILLKQPDRSIDVAIVSKFSALV